jgi:hypothetical protein
MTKQIFWTALRGAGDKAKRALAVLESFMSGLKVKLGDIEVALDTVLPRPLRSTHPG